MDDYIGLTKSQLEHELRWAMRRAPSDPARRLDYLSQQLIALMVKNNQAIAAALSERLAEAGDEAP